MTEADHRVTSRLFKPEDLRALYAIEEACFEPAARFSRNLMRTLAQDPHCRVWLGLIGQVRVGFAILGLHCDHSPNAAYLWTIEVLPAFRRHGVARQLLQRVQETASAFGRTAIELHVSERNPTALALYQRAGYRQFGTDIDYYGQGENGLRYRKLLDPHP